MVDGAPLTGAALAASRRHFQPRAHRCYRDSPPAAAGEGPAVSQAARGEGSTKGDGSGSRNSVTVTTSTAAGNERQQQSRRRRTTSENRTTDGGGDGGSSSREQDGRTAATSAETVAAALKVALAVKHQGGGTSESKASGGSQKDMGISSSPPENTDASDRAVRLLPPASSTALPLPQPPVGVARTLAAPAQMQAAAAAVAAAAALKVPPVQDADALLGVGGSIGSRRFFGSEEGNSGSGSGVAADNPSLQRSVAKKTPEEAGRGGGAREGEGGGIEGKQDAGQGKGDGEGEGEGGRKKRTWRAWDMNKPLAVGDRFDCLDYFVSSQVTRQKASSALFVFLL